MNTTAPTTDTQAGLAVLATLRDLGIYAYLDNGVRRLSQPVEGNLLDACKRNGDAITALLHTDEDACVLWHRLMRGAALLDTMEPSHDLSGVYGRALATFERLLARYERREAIVMTPPSLDERIAADRAWRECAMGRVAA